MAEGATRGPKWIRWLLSAVGLALVIGAVAMLFAPRPAPADIARAARGPIADSVADQGYARVREGYVVSAPIGGRLERIELHVGDPVTRGVTVITRIRAANAELLDPRARAQAEAAVAAARAALSAGEARRDELAAEALKAEQDLARAQTLAAKGFVAQQALDLAQTQARARRAAVRAATGEVGARRSELAGASAALLGPEAPGRGRVVVTSPASGYVTRVLQESERTVPIGAPLLEVSDRAGLEAAIEFLSQDAVRIREGMAAEVYDWGGPGVLPAVVRRVEPQAFTKVSALGVEEQRVLVFLQFKAPTGALGGLGPGYRLWGRVFLRQTPAATKVPLGALVRDQGGWAVFRLVEGRARLTPVRVGAMTDREAEVTAGVRPGDPLILFPSDKVRDGVRIRTRP